MGVTVRQMFFCQKQLFITFLLYRYGIFKIMVNGNVQLVGRYSKFFTLNVDAIFRYYALNVIGAYTTWLFRGRSYHANVACWSIVKCKLY
jgi:hypothetical protein